MSHSILSATQIESLTRFWQHAIDAKTNACDNWDNDLQNVYDLEIGMEEMLVFLYTGKPDLNRFLQWAGQRGRISDPVHRLDTDVLNESDIKLWQENGFVVLRYAVTDQECAEANKAVWEFLGADPDDPESWYRQHPAMSGLMVGFTEHKALQTTRNSARIRKAFEQLYKSTAIIKLIDKVSFNPPQNDHYSFKGSPLHWDTSLVLPIPERFQGLLYLTPVTATGGAFQCVPGFHRIIDQWMESVPMGTDPREYALKTLQPIPVPGNAGDMVIWHQALPHCASPNLDNKPRLVQYLTYIPEKYEDKRDWK